MTLSSVTGQQGARPFCATLTRLVDQDLDMTTSGHVRFVQAVRRRC